MSRVKGCVPACKVQNEIGEWSRESRRPARPIVVAELGRRSGINKIAMLCGRPCHDGCRRLAKLRLGAHFARHAKKDQVEAGRPKTRALAGKAAGGGHKTHTRVPTAAANERRSNSLTRQAALNYPKKRAPGPLTMKAHPYPMTLQSWNLLRGPLLLTSFVMT